MTITVHLFAWLRDAVNTAECRVTVPIGASALDARAVLVQQYHQLEPLVSSCRLAVNQGYRSWNTPLHDGDELSIIPPVSGG